MRLEDEITIAVPFRDEREKVIVNVVYTYNVLLERTLRILNPFDLNDQHFNILKTLAYHAPEPMSVGDIKRLLFNKRGDLTRLLDKLSDRGLIEREIDPDNRRVVLVTITLMGQAQLQQMDTQLMAGRDQQNPLSEDEARHLNKLLDKLRGPHGGRED